MHTPGTNEFTNFLKLKNRLNPWKYVLNIQKETSKKLNQIESEGNKHEENESETISCFSAKDRQTRTQFAAFFLYA